MSYKFYFFKTQERYFNLKQYWTTSNRSIEIMTSGHMLFQPWELFLGFLFVLNNEPKPFLLDINHLITYGAPPGSEHEEWITVLYLPALLYFVSFKSNQTQPLPKSPFLWHLIRLIKPGPLCPCVQNRTPVPPPYTAYGNNFPKPLPPAQNMPASYVMGQLSPWDFFSPCYF